MVDFVHLHVHTEYSLLDGAGRIEKLIAKAKDLGMKSLAITDHGVMYGVVDFYKQAVKYGIKPIIGCEVYVASRGRYDKDPKLDSNQYHLVLLAKNIEGYKNLIKLVSKGFTEGFYYKPRVDKDILRQYSDGLIALSACLAGEIPNHLMGDNYSMAKSAAMDYIDIFGKENFYIELQDHGIEEQRKIINDLIRLSKELEVKLVATNDVHYIEKDDYKAQDTLLCIQTGTNIENEKRLRFEGQEFYLKSPDEMYELFKFIPEAIQNTTEISQKCNMTFEFGKIHLPSFDVPEGYNSDTYLEKLTFEGLKLRYLEITPEIKERTEYELSIISKMGYSDYYLIVWDYVRFAKENNIMVGPGRGSGAGSIVAYSIGITNIDPIKYNLIFERFLNPERISMPDFDVDFCYERRQEVIDYVNLKYGKERVAQIVTFGTMAARAVIRDVGRALNMTYAEVDAIAKMIPMELGMTILKALEVNYDLKRLYEEDSRIKYLIDMSKSLEGMPRHTSTHAAGVVISKMEVTEYVPLQTNEDVITTQFTMGTLEELGLLKMDFLGLRTLTVIQDTLSLIKERGIEVPDIENIDYDDQNVYRMISIGDTYGVFQLESSGMTQFMKELKPNCLEDIIAGISLYRPGPMDQIPRYIKNKHNPSGVVYAHPKLESILNVTYGCTIYQEQVMQIVRELGGYSMGRSDLVRRAMGKKKLDVMAKERENFIHGIVDEKTGDVLVPGCVRNGISEDIAAKIFDELGEFAKYGFNKSHAASYAVIGYQTAWLKYYYPVEFTAALITSVMGSSKKVALYIAEGKKRGIQILPPNVNESNAGFTVSNKNIRFGLAAVKNVGLGAIDAIIQARKAGGNFKSLHDFINRVDLSAVNKKTVESLIKCGAFSGFSIYRSRMIAVYEKIMDSAHDKKKKNIDGQLSLFENSMNDSYSESTIYPNLDEYDKKTLLSMEKEMLGLYISGHPLNEFSEVLQSKVSITTSQLTHDNGDEDLTEQIQEYDGKRVIIGGIINSVKAKSTKNNSMMAFVEIEDLFGSIELIVFPKTYQNYKGILQVDNVILVDGRVSVKEEEDAKIIVERISELNSKKDSKLYIKINSNKKPDILNIVKNILTKWKGETPVFLVDEEHHIEKKRKVMLADRLMWVSASEGLINELTDLLGKDCITLK